MNTQKTETQAGHTPGPIVTHDPVAGMFRADIGWGIIRCDGFRMPLAEFKQRATIADAAPELLKALRDIQAKAARLLDLIPPGLDDAHKLWREVACDIWGATIDPIARATKGGE